MYEIEIKALHFAAAMHANHDRKYTGEDYIFHPIAVAEIVSSVPHTPEMIAAAILHDTVEDTRATLELIRYIFGAKVASLVFWLTDQSMCSKLNRAARKQMDLDHIAAAPRDAKTIKVADLLHNGESIREYDPDFWHVFRHEKIRLLGVLKNSDETLFSRALASVS